MVRSPGLRLRCIRKLDNTHRISMTEPMKAAQK